MREPFTELEETRVLIVDDDSDIRSVVSDLLAAQGAVTVGVPNAEEALVRFEQDGYDLVCVDLRLPGMDGIALMRRLRAIDPFARVLLMTAFGGEDVYVEAMCCGAAAMMKKPFTVDQLLSVAVRALEPR